MKAGTTLTMMHPAYIRYAVRRITQRHGKDVTLANVSADDFRQAFKEFEFFEKGTDDIGFALEATRNDGHKIYLQAKGENP